MSKDIAKYIIQILEDDENREISLTIKSLFNNPPLLVKTRKNESILRVFSTVKTVWKLNYDMFYLMCKGKKITLESVDKSWADLGIEEDTTMCCVENLRAD